MNQPRIAVLILGYNHKDTLRDTLNTVCLQTYPHYTVTYIDNASTDTSADFIQKNYPTIEVIRNPENLGYAGAYDIAINNAFSQDFEAVVLLNPDTVTDPDWLTELVRSAYASPDIALAQSKVLLWSDGPTNYINSFGNQIHFLGFGYCGHYQEKDVFTEDVEITYASGSSLFIKREYYPDVIRLDTTYFAYLEDQDIGWHARMLGYKIIVSAKSKVWHKYDFQKKSLHNAKFYLLERNRLFFLTKFYSFRLQCLVLPAFLIMECGVLCEAISKGYFFKKLKADMDYILALPRLLKQRKGIQKSRILSDKELFLFLSPTIDFAEVRSPILKYANRFFTFYYTCIKKFL
ncbi:MAG: glycosyltransferase family 2 protein [Minisyncoccota bacterium]